MPSGATDAVLERAHDLVVAAGQRQGDVFRHLFASLRRGLHCGRSEASFGRKIQPAAKRLAAPCGLVLWRISDRDLAEEGLDLAAELGDRALDRARGRQHGFGGAARGGGGAGDVAQHGDHRVGALRRAGDVLGDFAGRGSSAARPRRRPPRCSSRFRSCGRRCCGSHRPRWWSSLARREFARRSPRWLWRSAPPAISPRRRTTAKPGRPRRRAMGSSRWSRIAYGNGCLPSRGMA